jgi:formate hydrogenlyase subunit 3/multisubunit Na+/H+ antiporter MnhD subunit
MTRERLRSWAILVGIAIIATVFFDVSARVVAIVLGVLTLVFLVALWAFAVSWYRSNRTAISLMPDRQRNVMYLSMGAVTVPAAIYSITRLVQIDLAGWTAPLLLVFLAGLFGMFWAWQESKRYYF